MGLQGWQWLIVLAIVLILFGATRLPKLAKSLGQSTRIFKSEVKTMSEENYTGDESSERPAVESEVVSSPAGVHRPRKHKDKF